MASYEELKKLVLNLPKNYAKKLCNHTFTQVFAEGLNYWLKIDADKLKSINEFLLVSTYHITGIDDIVDYSNKRNGLPTTHLIYGMPFTVTSMMLCLFEAISLLDELHPDAIRLAKDGIIKTGEAVSMEVYWREQNICPTMEMFMKMSEEKTECVQVFFKLMQLFSENKKNDYTKFLKSSALYLLLLNDYLAYKTDSKYTPFKGEHTDVTEGKFTYPVIDAIQKEGANPQLLNILKMRTENADIKSYFVQIIKKHGSLDKLKTKLEELREQMIEELKELGGNPIFDNFIHLTNNLDNMVTYM